MVAAVAAVPGAALFAQTQILPDFQADPSARVWNDVLWIYPSHDIAGSTGWDMVDWHAFSSTDLKHWTDHGVIFGLKDLTWARKWAWAPDCMRRNGKFYFYFPADDQIGVVSGREYDPPDVVDQRRLDVNVPDCSLQPGDIFAYRNLPHLLDRMLARQPPENLLFFL